MFQLAHSNLFLKDAKLCKKRGYDMELIETVFYHLVKTGGVPAKNKPHKLIGNYNGYWECHIKPDWLLIWKVDNTLKIITLIRTGSHADLF